MAMEGQSSSPIGEVYRECLNISKKKSWQLCFFELKYRKSDVRDGQFLKKKKEANIFQEHLYDMFFPLFWERRNTPGKIMIILLKYVGGTLSKKLGGSGHYLEFR